MEIPDSNSRSGQGHLMSGPTINRLAWVLVALYGLVECVRAIWPHAIPLPIVAAFVTYLPFIFAFVHGLQTYGLKSFAVFVGVCFVVSNAMENTSILTGFPFGHYYYTEILGPKLFLVPIQVFAAYFGMGYVSWTLGRAILGDFAGPRPAARTITLPVTAAFIMVAWDLTCDPLASTVQQRWIWLDGGAYFGVPFVNFLGWYLTVFLFFQAFALYLHRSGAPITEPRRPTAYALQGIVLYAATAVYYPLALLTAPSGTVTDHAGVVWRLEDIYTTAALVAILVMGAFAAMAAAATAERAKR